MRKCIGEFMRRGLMACGLGPIVLAILYLVLYQQGVIEILTVNQVCLGIFSLAALAFIAGGMNVIYQIERLPLMIAILVHGGVLYISYLITYLLNDWLEWGIAPIMVFSSIFVGGYVVVWTVIYFSIKKKTENINELLKKKQCFLDDNIV